MVYQLNKRIRFPSLRIKSSSDCKYHKLIDCALLSYVHPYRNINTFAAWETDVTIDLIRYANSKLLHSIQRTCLTLDSRTNNIDDISHGLQNTFPLISLSPIAQLNGFVNSSWCARWNRGYQKNDAHIRCDWKHPNQLISTTMDKSSLYLWSAHQW